MPSEKDIKIGKSEEKKEETVQDCYERLAALRGQAIIKIDKISYDLLEKINDLIFDFKERLEEKYSQAVLFKMPQYHALVGGTPISYENLRTDDFEGDDSIENFINELLTLADVKSAEEREKILRKLIKLARLVDKQDERC